MVKLKIYVEGGNKAGKLGSRLQKALRTLIEHAGITSTTTELSISFCGGRSEALGDFIIALKSRKKCDIKENLILLVDSEFPIYEEVFQPDGEVNPWIQLLKNPDNPANRPIEAHNDDCHLMVQTMEAWLLSDSEAICKFFEINNNDLIFEQSDIEKFTKNELNLELNKVFKIGNEIGKKKKGKYSKSAHSYKILENIDSKKLENASFWAKRFFDYLRAWKRLS